MKKNSIMAFLLFAFLIHACSSFAAQDQELTDTEALLATLKPVCELVTSNAPSLKEGIQLIGGTICPGEIDHNRPTCFDKVGYRVSYRLEESSNDKSTTLKGVEFMIPNFITGFEFQDIISIFGKWELVGPEGKTSLVKFMYTNPKTKKTAIVFADLYDPPRNPKSPVMGLVIQKFDPGEIK